MSSLASPSPTLADAAPRTWIRPRVLVSGCLLGDAVRHDGGHRRDRFLTGPLAEHMELVPVCPEMAAGLGAPRPTLRLQRRAGEPLEAARLVESTSGADRTALLGETSERLVATQLAAGLDGAVLEKASPSCGVFRVKVWDHNGSPTKGGQGRFARALVTADPGLAVEDNGRLNDPVLREHFVLRVWTRARWRAYLQDDGSAAGLVAFHTRHKMLFLAQDPAGYRRLGPIVASAAPLDERLRAYASAMEAVLAVRASRGRHLNAMQHLAGFLKGHWRPSDAAAWQRVATDYREGLVPLIVPITLLRHHLARSRPHAWPLDQHYLRPYPRTLMLRNHA